MNQVPCLELPDGQMLCQSMTIARYLANEFNLAPKDNLQKAKADMTIDCYTDFLNSKFRFKYLSDLPL